MLENHENAERKLRQKMRVYPATAPVGTLGPNKSPDTAVTQRRDGRNDGGNNQQGAEKRRYEDARRKAIFSVYGKDLSSEDHIEHKPSGKAKGRKESVA